jgi:hypothetical protein
MSTFHPTISRINRRRFILLSSAVAGAAALPAWSAAKPRFKAPGDKLNIAVIGAGGKGESDTDSVNSENIVALCDVDKGRLTARGQKYPGAQLFQDYRIMLEKVKGIDAVIVATPDHVHAPASVMAMKMGMHCFCQKPLTHSVFEARTMRDVARKYGVATQMGNQGSAETGLRRAVEVIQAGAIGSVREVHVWSNRPIWPQGIGRPAGTDPVPAELDWDLWLGPAPFRPFKAGAYHPFNWRGWIDFGTGALGDMACHTANMPFRALKLGYPTEIEAESSGMNKETYPKTSKIRFEFPTREGLPPVRFWWYDGDPNDAATHRPQADVTKDVTEMAGRLPGSGCLLIGDKGQLFSPDDYGAQFYLKMKDEKEFVSSRNHDAVKNIPETIERSPGHYQEWLTACKGGKPAYSNFDIAAYLTEIILLGCVAMQAGKKLEWDGPNMRAKNAPESAKFVNREYRKGWKL